MKIAFEKYQGTGNDFVMVDNRQLQWNPSVEEVQKICHRKFGIGADGLILIQDHTGYDFEMIYFNADGSKSLCGNGSRCAIHFAEKLNIINNQTTFLTTDGPHSGEISENEIRFGIFDVTEIDEIEEDYFIDTGSPHFIRFVNVLSQIDVQQEGRQIRYAEKFRPGGTNVNFVEIKFNSISVRTYERGVEAETLSCGTGVTAAAIATHRKTGIPSPIAIETLGGKLNVSFEVNDNHYFNITLNGPAVSVYSGEIEI